MLLHINCWKYQGDRSVGIGCSYGEHWNFFFCGEATWRDLVEVTWPWATWVCAIPMCGKDVWPGVPKTAVLGISEKNLRGGGNIGHWKEKRFYNLPAASRREEQWCSVIISENEWKTIIKQHRTWLFLQIWLMSKPVSGQSSDPTTTVQWAWNY